MALNLKFLKNYSIYCFYKLAMETKVVPSLQPGTAAKDRLNILKSIQAYHIKNNTEYF